jgi:DNA-binding transcriptional LysR family regulator
MDRIDAMRAFVCSVDRGSLASAARAMGCSAASITRAIAMLELRLKTRLLHRNTRALHLTSFGDRYLATCREVLAALEMAERRAEGEQERPSGVLTVTAPLMFGQLHVRPVLDAFLDDNPSVRARLMLLDRVVSLVEEGIDVALRVGHLPDSTLWATRLGEVRRVLCASPAYLERAGYPRTPDALLRHHCIMERADAETELWRFAARSGKSIRPIAVLPRLMVNSAAAAVDSAREGHGIARVMSYQAAASVASGELVILLPKYEPPALPVHLVLPFPRARTAKQNAFVRFATARLRGALLRAAIDIGDPSMR